MPHILLTLLDNPGFQSNVEHQIKKYKANEKILEEGKRHADIYLVKTGAVRVLVSGSRGKEHQPFHPGIADLGPDSIFGEFGLFDDAPASADIVTVSETELIEINIKSLQQFLEANPKIGYKLLQDILQTLIERLRHSNKAILKLLEWGMKAHKLDEHLD